MPCAVELIYEVSSVVKLAVILSGLHEALVQITYIGCKDFEMCAKGMIVDVENAGHVG